MSDKPPRITRSDVDAVLSAIHHARMRLYHEPAEIHLPKDRFGPIGDYEFTGGPGTLFGIPFVLTDDDDLTGFDVIYGINAGLRPERFSFDGGTFLHEIVRDNAE